MISVRIALGSRMGQNSLLELKGQVQRSTEPQRQMEPSWSWTVLPMRER
jgi:hypothetical protein